MKITMTLLYISLVFFMVYGAYYSWIKPADEESDFLYLLWYTSELLEMAAIMFDIARLEITENNRKQVQRTLAMFIILQVSITFPLEVYEHIVIERRYPDLESRLSWAVLL